MINVIGLGFVGLTTALGFSYKGFTVTGIDKDKNKIISLKQNKIYFLEPQLESILKKCNKTKKISFDTNLNIKNNFINKIFICVGTPEKKNGDVDLSEIIKIIKDICNKYKKERIIIVIKSTIPPGTINNILNKIIIKNKNISLCSNPEFLREGYAWHDFLNADKIIIGSDIKRSQIEIKKLYEKFNGEKILTNSDTSEFIKYLSNCLLSNLISFSNEMMMLGEKLKNIDILKSFYSVKLDKRWSGYPANISSYFHPGLGFGGYCLPKDLRAINFLSKKKKISTKILNSVQRINKEVFMYQLQKVIKIVNKNQKICFLGVSFKPNSSDIRGSKPLELIDALIKRGYRNIEIHDPSISNYEPMSFSKNVKIKKKLKYKKENFYILTTAWSEYLNFIKKRKPIKFIDLRYT
jgi:UDPglucose 6-dehydrogenase